MKNKFEEYCNLKEDAFAYTIHLIQEEIYKELNGCMWKIVNNITYNTHSVDYIIEEELCSLFDISIDHTFEESLNFIYEKVCKLLPESRDTIQNILPTTISKIKKMINFKYEQYLRFLDYQYLGILVILENNKIEEKDNWYYGVYPELTGSALIKHHKTTGRKVFAKSGNPI